MVHHNTTNISLYQSKHVLACGRLTQGSRFLCQMILKRTCVVIYKKQWCWFITLMGEMWKCSKKFKPEVSVIELSISWACNASRSFSISLFWCTEKHTQSKCVDKHCIKPQESRKIEVRSDYSINVYYVSNSKSPSLCCPGSQRWVWTGRRSPPRNPDRSSPPSPALMPWSTYTVDQRFDFTQDTDLI